MSKKAFVLGASGFQGSAIARKMISNGYVVSTLSSDPAKPTLPAAVEVIEGGLNAPSLIEEALKGVAVAIYTFPVLFDLEKALSYTQNFIAAAKNQRVPLVIYNSSADVPDSPTGLLGQDLKIEIQDMLEKSGLSVLTLMPDIYLDNLAAPWSIPLVLEKKILPYPIKSGAKIPWISHEDLARFVAAAPEKPSLAGQKLPIGGTLLSGEEIAAAISQHLGETIHFVSLQPDDFEGQLRPAFGEVTAREIANLYRYLEQNREKLIQKPFATVNELLGVQPQSIAEWVQSVRWSVA